MLSLKHTGVVQLFRVRHQCSYLVTEMLKGMNIDDAHEIKNSAIAEELALPPVKIHCSVLAEDAIKSAIKDYKDKNA